MCAVLVHGQRQNVFGTDARVQSLALCRVLNFCLRTQLPHRYAMAGVSATLGGRFLEVFDGGSLSDGGSLFDGGSVRCLCMVFVDYADVD